MRYPLHVAFVWHMHQPYYLDTARGDLMLPWVRLHATKDYLHMVEVLEDYPRVHATFNLVPSLVEQLQGYVDESVSDRARDLTLKGRLTAEEKRYVDGLFFSISRENFIKRYPRYWQLLRLREEARGDLDLLGDGYWRDLLGWFNLAWIDPGWIRRDPVLQALVDKGSHFSVEELATILTKHREIMAATLPAYRRLQRRGQIELSVSPYYHPILPLLIDSDSAREPSPWITLPKDRFRHPEDALDQLRGAVRYHEKTFGRIPAGLWPSEGAVSQEAVDLLREVPEIQWLATDEAILARSLGRGIERNGWGYVADPCFLYQPYWVRSGDHRVAAVFRDHYLSDRVGFTYQGMTGDQAAEDLLFRLASIHQMVKDESEPYLVPIILDGENCWEHYEENGETFLRSLYRKLSDADWVRAVTVNEYLQEYPPRREIPRLATGSWINGNLETWIGEETQNRAWEYLHDARGALEEAEQREDVPVEGLDAARRCIRTAEGSDWFWWYYSHNVSDQDELFDRLFRHYIAGVYRALGQRVPEHAYQPILARGPKVASRGPTGYVRAPVSVLDISPVYWASAGFLEPRGSSGTMQQSSALIKRLYYGHDGERLYLRLESPVTLKRYLVAAYAASLPEGSWEYEDPTAQRPAQVQPTIGRATTEIAIRPEVPSVQVSRWQEEAGWVKIDASVGLAVADTAVEAVIPLATLGVHAGGAVGLSLVLFREGIVVQRLPEDGEIVLELAQYS